MRKRTGATDHIGAAVWHNEALSIEVGRRQVDGRRGKNILDCGNGRYLFCQARRLHLDRHSRSEAGFPLRRQFGQPRSPRLDGAPQFTCSEPFIVVKCPGTLQMKS